MTEMGNLCCPPIFFYFKKKKKYKINLFISYHADNQIYKFRNPKSEIRNHVYLYSFKNSTTRDSILSCKLSVGSGLKGSPMMFS